MADTDYRKEASEEADGLVEEHLDEIVEKLLEDGEADKDISEYDQDAHSSLADRAYQLIDAANILDDLGDYEETDSGLWNGYEERPETAVIIKASYTYANAVVSYFSDVIDDVNSELSDRVEELRLGRDRLFERQRELEAIDEKSPEEEAELDGWDATLDKFDANAKKILKRDVLIAIGKIEKPRDPKDWHP